MNKIMDMNDLQDGQMLTDEMWDKLDKEIVLHSDEELKDGFIVHNDDDKLFFAIKRMAMGIDMVKIEPAFTAKDAEQKLDDLNILNIAPGGVSRATGKTCPDRVWLIGEEGKIINPATGRPCAFNKSKAGKAIVAHDPTFGPFFVGILNSDIDGDGNFNCAGFYYIDEAIDFVENRRWLSGEFVKDAPAGVDKEETK